MCGVMIRDAETAAEIEQARQLFIEYAQSLGFSLCFQGFDQELAGLPGKYARPDGRLLLAEVDGKTAGCVGLRPLESEICEMKRLFVRPEFRGMRLGRLLAERVITGAREIGYTRMRLDTIASIMVDAVGLYRQLGFVEIPPYCANPIPDALYMELALNKVEK
jgi:ribosomal protein S18 acetylase RimI-like enzyme